MRYTTINGLLLLAISPLAALALPIDPNDQAGQWDPNGQYRKGHWQNGQFIANNNNNRYNQHGQVNQNGYVDQNGQWVPRSVASKPLNSETVRKNGASLASGIQARSWPQDQNRQGGWTDANGQWHASNNQDPYGWTDANGKWHNADGTIQARNWPNDQNKNGWTDANGKWHANNENPNGWTDANGKWHNADGTVQARNWPNDQNKNGWTDANGQWHPNNNQDPNGWTDANGQWHPNNNQDPNGWTDANGKWHANNEDQNGWTDANGQWHANQKRQVPSHATKTEHRRSWRDAGNDQINQNNGYQNQNGNNRDGLCRGINWNNRECRKNGALPTPSIAARTWPADNSNVNAQVTPSSQNNKYQSYGNYKHYGSYQNYPANPQDQNQNKNIKANVGQQE